jgi:hypothetical protein
MWFCRRFCCANIDVPTRRTLGTVLRSLVSFWWQFCVVIDANLLFIVWCVDTVVVGGRVSTISYRHERSLVSTIVSFACQTKNERVSLYNDAGAVTARTLRRPGTNWLPSTLVPASLSPKSTALPRASKTAARFLCVGDCLPHSVLFDTHSRALTLTL